MKENIDLTFEERNVQNDELPHSLRRTLYLVRDVEKEYDIYQADEVLDGKPDEILMNMRSALTAAFQSGAYKYTCAFCGQPILLKNRSGFFFFSHIKDNDAVCPLRTTTHSDPTQIILDQEEEFRKSQLYANTLKLLKRVVDTNSSYTAAEQEKIILNNSDYSSRIPSFYFEFEGKCCCFDLLVLNPLLGLLVHRDAFFKSVHMFHLWLFPSFSTKDQRKSVRDILFMQRRNVFVFDASELYSNDSYIQFLCNKDDLPNNHIFAFDESIKRKKLMLNCYWQVPVIKDDGRVVAEWRGPKLIAFEDIHFDEKTYEAYYYDSSEDFYNVAKPEDKPIIEEWINIKRDRWRKIFDGIERRELLREQYYAKKERSETLKYYVSKINSGVVSPKLFKSRKTGLLGFAVKDFVIISPKYYSAFPFVKGICCVKNRHRWGFIDAYGKKVTSFIYSNVKRISDYLFLCDGTLLRYDGTVVVFNTVSTLNAKTISSSSVMSITALTEDLYKVVVNFIYFDKNSESGEIQVRVIKNGCINKRGDVIFPFIYDMIGLYKYGFVVASLNNRIGVLDSAGNTIVPFEYNSIYDMTENGVTCALKDGKWGCIDSHNNIVAPFKYDRMKGFIDGKAKAIYNGKCGFLNETGEVVIPFDFDAISDFYNGYAKIQIGRGGDKGIGLIDTNGNVIIPANYSDVGIPSGSDCIEPKFFMVKKFGNWGRIDKNGEAIHENETPLFDDVVKFMSFNLWGIKKNEIIITEAIYNEILPLEELSLCKVRSTSYWGCIDSSGRIIIPIEYDSIKQINGGMFSLGKENRFGCCRNDGELVIPIKYNKPIKSKYGKLEAELNDQKGYFDFNGNIVAGGKKRKLTKGLYVFLSFGKSGLVKADGTIVLPAIYDEIEFIGDNQIKVRFDDHWELKMI